MHRRRHGRGDDLGKNLIAYPSTLFPESRFDDPTSPVAVGLLETPFANAVLVTDSYVYIADRDWGLVIAEEE